MLTADRLREVLSYDPIDGLFRWRIATSTCVKVGATAGSLSKVWGYIELRLDKRLHKAHRLAWLYMTGEWPIFEIDHRDTDRANNRWDNLRDVPHSVNQQNRRRAQANGSTGLLGVTFDKAKGKFMAQIRAPDRSKFVGYFDSAEVAHTAYVAAKREHHAGCTL